MQGIPYNMQRKQPRTITRGRAIPRRPPVKRTQLPLKPGNIRAPVAINRSSGQSGRNTQRYRECERISTVPGSVAFNVNSSIPMNPGISGSFPWLSGHANLFEKYRVHKLIYRYKNLKGTSTDGNVLMSFDYDTLDAPPASAIEMTQATHWADGAPWRIFELKVPTDGRILFTRSGSVSSSDAKTYDMGKLHIASEGCADTTDHGYLEVEYDVELMDKQPNNGGSVPAPSSVSEFNLSADDSGVAPGETFPFDETALNGLSLTNTLGSFTGFDGYYKVDFNVKSFASTSETYELEVNGASVAIPVLCEAKSTATSSMSHVLALTSTDTLTIKVTVGTGTTLYGDHSRILITKL